MSTTNPDSIPNDTIVDQPIADPINNDGAPIASDGVTPGVV